jgi:uncharacterized membrane protein YphA (DoxX/SURF4 family)
MDTSNTQAEVRSEPGQRGSAKFGLGAFLIFLAALLALAATILIWFGVFPGLVAIGVALPLAVMGVRMMRKGKPATTLRD